MGIYKVRVDTEWASDDQLLTAQVVCDNKIYFYYNSGFPHITKTIREYTFFEHFKDVQYKAPIFVPFDCTHPLEDFIYEDFFNRHFVMKDAARVLRNSSENKSNYPPNKNIKENKKEKEKKNEKEKITLYLCFFYSMRDVTYFLGDEVLKYCGRNFPKKNNVNYILQKNKIDGRITRESKTILETFSNEVTIVLKDRFGWTSGSRKFDDLCGMLAIPKRFKGNCDEFKAKMEVYLTEGADTTGFINYAINDVLQLVEVDSKMPQMLNTIYSKMNLGGGILFTEENIPDSIGAIVACFLDKLVSNHFYKTGNHQNFKIENQRWEVEKDYSTTIRSRIKSDATLGTKTKNGVPKTTRSTRSTRSTRRPKGDYLSSLLSAGGVRSWFYLNRNNSTILNAIVQGGRTYNEQFYNYKADNCFDIDFTGCYGNALNQFILPVGLSSICGVTSEQTPVTVREFYKEHESELVDNLYQLTISGTIPFSQNLLYSKLTDATKISRKMDVIQSESEFEVAEEFGGEFVVLENELRNTIITSDIKEAIDKICYPYERKAFYDCYVETASFYKKSDEKNPADFIKTLQEADPSKCYKYKTESRAVIDERPRSWTGIPLKDLIDPLLILRKELKTLIKQGIDPFVNDCLQKLVKLLCNTVYGVLASPFFQFGNTVLANNITARARLNVWLMSRALHGIQSITDGCQYRPEEVLSFKTHEELKKNLKKNLNPTMILPGLETLSDLKKLKKHRFIKTESLGGEDWHTYISGLKETKDFSTRIDLLAYEHISKFWDHYGLKIQYQVEHKPENVAKKLFWIKRAHYGIRTVYDKLDKLDNKLDDKLEPSKTNNYDNYDNYEKPLGAEGLEALDPTPKLNLINGKRVVQDPVYEDPNPYRTKKMTEKKVVPKFRGVRMNDTICIESNDNLSVTYPDKSDQSDEKIRRWNESIPVYSVITQAVLTDRDDEILKIDSLTRKEIHITRVGEYLDSIKQVLKYDIHRIQKIRNKLTNEMEDMPKAVIVKPGYTMIKNTTFALNNNDLPYRDYKEWRVRQSIGNSIDYGPRFLYESPKAIFEARINDHIHRFDGFDSDRTHVNSTKKNRRKN